MSQETWPTLAEIRSVKQCFDDIIEVMSPNAKRVALLDANQVWLLFERLQRVASREESAAIAGQPGQAKPDKTTDSNPPVRKKGGRR